MKKMTYSLVGLFFIMVCIAIAFVSCNKEDSKPETTKELEQSSDVDFSEYFEEARKYEIQFWAACDVAYKTNQNDFIRVCSENDFESFKRITNLDEQFFEDFTNEILRAQSAIEADYPGISDEYRESPCNECINNALERVGKVVTAYHGNTANEINYWDPKDCWFVCSLACMSTMELYIPCVLGCVELCTRISN